MPRRKWMRYRALRVKMSRMKHQVPTDEARITRRSTRERRIPTRMHDYDMGFMTALAAGHLPNEIPQSFEEAVQDEGWSMAIKEEISNLERNKTWSSVRTPVEENIIESRWVFTRKTVEGGVTKKARLVAKGFQQEDTYEETIYSRS
uniref:Uncharacterized protein n=1 Tax=Photinus pyralis TaxID=7054 RepID=A0A1Y1KT50_PHOPY